MSKTKKTPLRWVDRVGSLVTEGLTRRHGRPFVFHQGGPYTQDKHPMVEIYFHEAFFTSLPRKSPNDKYDDRFGFVIRNEYRKHLGQWAVFAGFMLRNKVIARAAFAPNLAVKQDEIADKLGGWINAAMEHGFYLNFDQIGGGKYFFGMDHSFDDLIDSLSKYPDLDRKSSGIHSDRIAGWSGADFSALQVMPQFKGMSDDQTLLDSAGKIANSALIVFDELSFLYDLLIPRDQLQIVPAQPISSCARVSGTHHSRRQP